MSIYKELIIAMVRTGILGFGGGPSVIPLIRHEAVKRFKWLEDEEFGETYAIANALPGPIATKMAAYLGYKLKGTVGAIVATLAHILPSSLAMIVLFALADALSGSEVVAGMIAAITPVVGVMLGIMAYEFAAKAVKGLGKVLGVILFVISFVLLQTLNVHPGIVIIIFLAYGSVHFKLRDKFKKNNGDKNEKENKGGASA
ncbi:chromate transporter [Priestia koreensis]|uniref:chromate transporter n=1 Tax=Priestia koreensis TaxID=284581 RepID=UPI001F5AC5D3|nr:chromate transporter [Priestia koreensis]UNL83086.1 chromate transporter [Priestia koreensis]